MRGITECCVGVAPLDAHAAVEHEAVGRNPVEAYFHDVVVLRQRRVDEAVGLLYAEQRLNGVLVLVVEVGVEGCRPPIIRTDLETMGNRVRLVDYPAGRDGQVVDGVLPIEIAILIATGDRQPSLGIATAIDAATRFVCRPWTCDSRWAVQWRPLLQCWSAGCS